MLLDLNPPIINASGILSFPDVFKYLETKGAVFGGFVTKSIGLEQRDGNENPVIFDNGKVMLNSLALPNQGIEAWIEELEYTKLKKPLIASIFGLKADEYAEVAKRIEPYVQGFELNLGCPNFIPGEVSIMDIVGKYPGQVSEILSSVRKVTEKPIIAKLTPNSDYIPIAEVSLNAGADYIGCANTLGPGIEIDIWAGKPVLSGISGGLSGDAIRPVILKMVYDIYSRFKAPVIAYGGISSWEHAVEYFMAGACVVGLGTCLAYKSSREIIKFTKKLWKGIQGFLDGRELDKIIGAVHV